MGPSLWIVDCVEGASQEVNGGPFLIGSLPLCDLRIAGGSTGLGTARIQKRENLYVVKDAQSADTVILDGQKVASQVLDGVGKHSLVVDGHPFALLVAGVNGRQWLGDVNPKEWWIYRQEEQAWDGLVQLWEVSMIIGSTTGIITMCSGMTAMGFYAEHIVGKLGDVGASDGPPPLKPADVVTNPEVSKIDTEYGEFTCPVCWVKFDRGNLMNIGVHASLRGDPVLGEEHMQRFLASRFNDRGQAIDAMGVAAPENACPHCRLPVLIHGAFAGSAGLVGFLDVGASMAAHLGVPSKGPGRSFLS